MEEYTFECRRVMEGTITFETDNPTRDIEHYVDFPFEEVDWQIVDESVENFYQEEDAPLDHDDTAEREELITELADTLEALMGESGDEPLDDPASKKLWKSAQELIEEARG